MGLFSKATLTICCSLVWFLLADSDAVAKVSVKERTKHYTVSGNSGAEIFESMVKRGPKLSGFRRKALASAEIEFVPRNVKVAQRKGRCVITSVEIRVLVQYTLPKWRQTKQASRNTRSAWKNFSKTAVWHEKQHTRIAKDHAKKIEQLLRSLRPSIRRNCNPQSFKLRSRLRSLNRQHERRQAAFDRKDLGKGGRGFKAQVKLLRAK